MDSMCAELDYDKLVQKVVAVHDKKEQENQHVNLMGEEKKEPSFDAVAAQLGFSEDEVKLKTVSARVAELVKSESTLAEVRAKLKSVEDSLGDLKIKLTGKEAEVTNLQAKLNDTEASLESYRTAEKLAKETEKNSLIEDAINKGKIDESAKSTLS